MSDRKENSFNWLVPGFLAVGDWHAGSDLKKLKEMGIRGVVAATRKLPRKIETYEKNDIAILHIPVRDAPDANIIQWFAPVHDFIDYFMTKNKKKGKGYGVLVHCAAGRSRSVTILTSFVMKRLDLPPAQALNMVRTVRPCEWVNDGFIKQLKDYRTFLLAEKKRNDLKSRKSKKRSRSKIRKTKKRSRQRRT
jgi:hypothetical protein